MDSKRAHLSSISGIQNTHGSLDEEKDASGMAAQMLSEVLVKGWLQKFEVI